MQRISDHVTRLFPGPYRNGHVVFGQVQGQDDGDGTGPAIQVS